MLIVYMLEINCEGHKFYCKLEEDHERKGKVTYVVQQCGPHCPIAQRAVAGLHTLSLNYCKYLFIILSLKHIINLYRYTIMYIVFV